MEALMREISGGGKTVLRLLTASEAIWERYLDHPFVRGLADGSLSRERFQFYMLQDYRYLFAYAKVFAVGIAKGRSEKVMRCFSRSVSGILDGEMEIHRAYMRRLGIGEAEAERTEPSLDNLSYTSYMLRLAYEGDAAEIAAAILSCALSYEWIAKKILARRPEAEEHPFFGEWIRGYVSESYCAGNRELTALLEELAEGAAEERLLELEKIFRRCSGFEERFWDMAWECRP